MIRSKWMRRSLYAASLGVLSVPSTAMSADDGASVGNQEQNQEQQRVIRVERIERATQESEEDESNQENIRVIRRIADPREADQVVVEENRVIVVNDDGQEQTINVEVLGDDDGEAQVIRHGNAIFLHRGGEEGEQRLRFAVRADDEEQEDAPQHGVILFHSEDGEEPQQYRVEVIGADGNGRVALQPQGGIFRLHRGDMPEEMQIEVLGEGELPERLMRRIEADGHAVYGYRWHAQEEEDQESSPGDRRRRMIQRVERLDHDEEHAHDGDHTIDLGDGRQMRLRVARDGDHGVHAHRLNLEDLHEHGIHTIGHGDVQVIIIKTDEGGDHEGDSHELEHRIRMILGDDSDDVREHIREHVEERIIRLGEGNETRRFRIRMDEEGQHEDDNENETHERRRRVIRNSDDNVDVEIEIEGLLENGELPEEVRDMIHQHLGDALHDHAIQLHLGNGEDQGMIWRQHANHGDSEDDAGEIITRVLPLVSGRVLGTDLEPQVIEQLIDLHAGDRESEQLHALLGLAVAETDEEEEVEDDRLLDRLTELEERLERLEDKIDRLLDR